jgi:hypothetical protein
VQAIELTPSEMALESGQTQQFSAMGAMSDGSTQPVAVSWSATGGTISTAGLYTAGGGAGTFRVIARQTGGTLADTASVTITAPPPPPPPPATGLTGLDFLGNADGRSTMFVFNSALSGTVPLAPFPATYIWRAYPRSGQSGYWSSLFHAHYTTGAFSATYFYYGAHPYPSAPTKWEISAAGDDFLGRAVTFDRWYTQVLTISANGLITFYYDWDAQLSLSYQDDITRPGEPNPAIIVGDAPWNRGNEIYYGVLRGFQYYDALLTPTQINQELATPGAARRPWYLNLNPTPSDISDKSGNGHHPAWIGANRPQLWAEP